MISILFKKIFPAAALLIALGGCSVSPAVDAVSWGVDGLTYLISGKSMTDHAMSAASGKDCAMVRVVKGEKTCVPNDEDVAGDRLVFSFESPVSVEGSAVALAGDDPLRIGAGIEDVAGPLGGSVEVETRSPAMAAVAADSILLHSLVERQEDRAGTPVFSAFVKRKATANAAAPDRATRLWLPAD